MKLQDVQDEPTSEHVGSQNFGGAPKIDFGSHARTSTKSAPDCDLEPFLRRVRIGTLGPRLNA